MKYKRKEVNTVMFASNDTIAYFSTPLNEKIYLVA